MGALALERKQLHFEARRTERGRLQAAGGSVGPWPETGGGGTRGGGRPGVVARPGGSFPCWNKACARVQKATSGRALCDRCQTFEFGSRPCLRCKMTSSPRATRCDNLARGCTGGIAEFGPALIPNTSPGSSVFLLCQQVGALALERDQLRIAARNAKRATRPGLFRSEYPTGFRSWGPRCTRVHQAALHATGPAAQKDGGNFFPREDAALQRVLECLRPGADGLLAAASLTAARSARKGWAALSRPRLPSADWLADEAVHKYFAHEERRRCDEIG